MKRALLLPMLMLLALSVARAALREPITMEAGAQAAGSFGCCFEALPRSGYAPITVTINNYSGATRDWTFDFTSPAWYSSNRGIAFSATVTVENNATRTIALLVPVDPSLESNGGALPLQVATHGYGVRDATQTLGSTLPAASGGYRFVVISNSLGTAAWSQIESKLHSSSNPLAGSLVDSAALPEDWRGLSGVSGIWLSASEADQLSPAQRDALRTWLQLGGTLMLCGASGIPADFQPAGFGEVKLLPAKLDVNATVLAIPKLKRVRTEVFGSAPDAKSAGLKPVAPNVPGLISFLALFAIVVGPVNIFVLAGSNRRQRLFWTTPLISIAASAGIFAFILMQDGLGGHGVRTAFVYVSPREHREVLLQQQISRTGLLLGSDFQTRDPIFLEQHVKNEGFMEKQRHLRSEDTDFSGDWFSSRSLQVQQLEAVEPTRGEITLVNAREVRESGAAPVILSSFDAGFDELTYMDEQHRFWIGKNVRAGARQTLAAGESTGMHLTETNTFAARGQDSAAFVETLRSIHWRDEPVQYFGPVTIPPAP